jgi:hypothetical protein
MLDQLEQRPPIARKTDPDSSHLAAEEVTVSGRRDAQKEIVLVAVKKYIGATSAELAAHYGFDRYMVARRLPDLEKDGDVAKGQELRVCQISGRKAVTWWPNGEAE